MQGGFVASLCFTGPSAVLMIGILLAALYNPVWISGVRGTRDVAAVLLGFGFLHWWKMPPWLVV